MNKAGCAQFSRMLFHIIDYVTGILIHGNVGVGVTVVFTQLHHCIVRWIHARV